MESQLFRPEYVYRALLKMALSILPEKDIIDYEMAFKLLLDTENYQELNKYVLSKLILHLPDHSRNCF
jgi:hypothetical protein